MNFEHLQKTWHTESEQTRYTFNEVALSHEVISQQKRNRCTAVTVEWGLFAVFAFIVVSSIGKLMATGEWVYIVPMALFLCAFIFMWQDRRQRLAIDRIPAGTVLQQVNTAIASLELQIRRQRNYVWWFVLPSVLTLLSIWMWSSVSKPWWVWVLAGVVLPASVWLTQREIDCVLMPRRENLIKLRHLLMEEPTQGC